MNVKDLINAIADIKDSRSISNEIIIEDEYIEDTVDNLTGAGDVTDEAARDEALLNIRRQVEALLTDKEKLAGMKRALIGITDGRGAVRIAKALLP